MFMTIKIQGDMNSGGEIEIICNIYKLCQLYRLPHRNNSDYVVDVSTVRICYEDNLEGGG